MVSIRGDDMPSFICVQLYTKLNTMSYSRIIESVDCISRDGPDTPIYVIHDKYPKNLKASKLE